jgi:hypothetical protein
VLPTLDNRSLIQLGYFCYSKFLKTNFQLTAAVMEALNSLSLDSTLRTEVCQLMLQTLNKAPPEFLPAIVGFLISSDEPIENLVEVGYNFVSYICHYIMICMYDIIKCSFVYAYSLYQYTVKAGLSDASRNKWVAYVAVFQILKCHT